MFLYLAISLFSDRAIIIGILSNFLTFSEEKLKGYIGSLGFKSNINFGTEYAYKRPGWYMKVFCGTSLS
jgi:hypothetical protein